MKIKILFKNHPSVEISVNDTETGRLYFDLTRKYNQQQPPFYRDVLIYTPDYMIELAHRAKDAFGWDWLSDSYDLTVTAKLHKDLENSLGKLGFANIPEEYDDLLYDLHHCLHAIQGNRPSNQRLVNFQLEWFVDESIPLPASFKFQDYANFGDLILINPHVGHNPLQIWAENDFSSLETTCKFHNVIRPGVVLTNQRKINVDTILDAFQTNDPAFVELHGIEKIRYYTGLAVIGSVTDQNLFHQIKRSPDIIEIDHLEFYD